MEPPVRALLETLKDSGPMLAVAMLAAGLAGLAPEAHERWIQEDGPVEWTTFWAFLAAGVLGLRLGLTARRSHARRPLTHGPGTTEARPDHAVIGPLTVTFLLLFGVGCSLIALEEISWGQRLLGYRPPEVFLTDNFQQELNLHNLSGADTRGLLLTGLLAAFGVAYPLLGRLPVTRALLQRLGIPALPLTVVPGFAVLIITYASYPWQFTGEWVELGAGVGFLQAAVAYHGRTTRTDLRWIAVVVGAGIITALGQSVLEDPARQKLAEEESRALAEDFAAKRYRSRCGVHKRVHTFVSEYGGAAFHTTSFGRLSGSEADLARRRYFLDPWNLPYWIRHTCSRDRQESNVVVYSFGENRRRDSIGDTLAEDDVGAVIRHPRSR